MTNTILRKKKDNVKRVRVIDIPDGYTTVQDLSDDCTRCDFNTPFVNDLGEADFKCEHPNLRDAGCVDGRIVFKKINK